MKKIVLAIIAVVLLMNLFGGESSQASSLDFVSIDRQFRNGQFIVKGHLLNHETNKTITGIKNGYILLCDANGKVKNKVALDSSLKKCNIGPNGSLAYSFTMDASKVKFDYAFDIYFEVEAKCTYGKAEAPRPAPMPQPTFKPAPAPAPAPGPERVLCTVCKTSGSCKFCHGSGIYSNYGGSVICTSCNGYGDCFKCDGEGYYFR